ncbi:MAG TPA: trypsin-like peptidase domain-containing protein [Candidatus Limnocylindria bacterium]|nr:trypsin-like peptidase domain-containing protein [Candidatus Limnocylindria bacterium]
MIYDDRVFSHPAAPPPEPPRRERRGLRRAMLGALLFLTGTLVGEAAVIATAPAAPQAAAPTPAETRLVSVESPNAVEAAIAEVLPAVVTVVHATVERSVGSGTGLVIDRRRGFVVTNSHVVEDSRSTRATGSFAVILSDGTRLAATVVGNDPSTDVAVLRVEGALPAEARLSTTPVALGARVIAIGSPGTSGRASGLLTNTVTAGIVSATGRSLPRPDVRNVQLTDLVQTDAAINSGMSGGPLVSVATREVVGLNTLVVRGSGEEGLGFAVSAATVARVSAQLIAAGGG